MIAKVTIHIHIRTLYVYESMIVIILNHTVLKLHYKKNEAYTRINKLIYICICVYNIYMYTAAPI